MNTSTPTRIRIFAAGAIFAFAPTGSASAHTPALDSHTTATQFDVAEFVAHAKTRMAHDLATRPTHSAPQSRPYSAPRPATRNESATTGADAGQDVGERVAELKARASQNRGAGGQTSR